MDHVIVRKGSYHDSAFLMRVSRELKRVDGVAEAEVMMGTPMNRGLLAAAGYPAGPLEGVTPMDLVIAIRAADEAAARRAADAVGGLLAGGDAPRVGGGTAEALPRGVAEAATRAPDAGLVTVAVPGAYAAYVTSRALDLGRHVFLFSDNVPLEDEVALKRRAVEAGLFVMGPDCGTAIVGGVGLGFANRVPRGPVGIVGASGTGMQEVSCIVANAGVGISHAIGTGGRDLSREVGARMTEAGLRLLADDPGTQAIVLVAKHPHPEVAERLHRLLVGLGKPVSVRWLGTPGKPGEGAVTYHSTLFGAAAAAVRSTVPASELEGRLLQAIAWAGTGRPPAVSGRIVGLYGGGSLASEAKFTLKQLCGVETRTPDRPLKPGAPIDEPGHLVIDTGDDFYTLGKPHPMIDQAVRCGLIRTAGADPSVGVVLLDLVLGDGAHPDPGPEVAAAVEAARTARPASAGPVLFVGSVCGTEADPQCLSRQAAVLRAAGVHLCATASAAAFGAAIALGLNRRDDAGAQEVL